MWGAGLTHMTADPERARQSGGEHVMPLADLNPAGNKLASRQTGRIDGGQQNAVMLRLAAAYKIPLE